MKTLIAWICGVLLFSVWVVHFAAMADATRICRPHLHAIPGGYNREAKVAEWVEENKEDICEIHAMAADKVNFYIAYTRRP